jgi:hypothetical protein
MKINAGNPKLHKHSVMCFYFKVKNSKRYNQEKLQRQIELCIKRLIKTHNIKSGEIEIMFGTVDDDFVYNRCGLRIYFNCA